MMCPFFVRQHRVLNSSHRMYGSPTDVKIKKIDDGRVAGMDVYEASFTTLTPAMRERFVGVNIHFPHNFLMISSS